LIFHDFRSQPKKKTKKKNQKKNTKKKKTPESPLPDGYRSVRPNTCQATLTVLLLLSNDFCTVDGCSGVLHEGDSRARPSSGAATQARICPLPWLARRCNLVQSHWWQW
jgi:hypothetical protein